jgi:hypothetical protein
MPGETDEIVRSIGLELVTRLAPEELPLYPSLASQFEGTNGGGGKASSDDQILGFGAGEVMMLLTPVILSFTRSFWQALIDQAAQTALRGVLQHLQVRRAGHQHGAEEVPRLSEEQVQLVRKVAEQQARRLNVSDGQAGLLADAMVGVLVAPSVS